MQKTRILRSTALCLFVIAVVVATGMSSGARVSDPALPGPYAVGHTSFLLFDSGRISDNFPAGRPIPVYVWYPVDPIDVDPGTPEAVYPLDPYHDTWPPVASSDWEAWGIDGAYEKPVPSSEGPFPLILHSHGWGGGQIPVMSMHAPRLASHGFVVAGVTHMADTGFMYFMDPTITPDSLGVALYNRPRDLSFVLTHLLERNEIDGDLLYNTIRPDQIAASGHSLGGYAAMTLVCGDDVVQGTSLSTPPDPRIAAIVPLDGSNQYLTFEEMERIAVPTLSINQEYATIGVWQARQHAAIQGHPSYRVDIANSRHAPSFSPTVCEGYKLLRDKEIMSEADTEKFLNLRGCYTPGLLPTAESRRLITMYMIAFLKTYLAGESGYQRMLTPGWAIAREQDVEFFVTEKAAGNPTDPYVDPDHFLFFPHQPGSLREKAEKNPGVWPSVELWTDWP